MLFRLEKEDLNVKFKQTYTYQAKKNLIVELIHLISEYFFPLDFGNFLEIFYGKVQGVFLAYFYKLHLI